MQELLDRFHVTAADVPVLICRGEVVLKNPTNQEIADCLGFNEAIDSSRSATSSSSAPGPPASPPRSTALGGARRAGARDECARRPGRLELARSRTISDFRPESPAQELAARALTQAQKFGAEMLIAQTARSDSAAIASPMRSRSTADTRVPARTIIIATGAEYRKLRARRTCRGFEGAGIYYGATFIEAQLCGGEEVIVVGGGNSAGQAAVFLAQTARHVHMLVRSAGLARACRDI